MSKNISKKSLRLLSFIIIFSFLFTLTINNTASAADIEVILDKLEVKQGEIIKVTLRSNTLDLSRDDYTANFSWNNFSFYPSANNELVSYIGVSYWNETGKTPLKIKQNGNDFYYNKIKILSGNFDKSYIEVSKDKEKLVRPDEEDKKLKERLEKDNEMVTKARTNTSPKKLWNDNFIWPLKGVISTDFGATRFVNGKLQSKHSGIDIAADTGTTVKASNDGIVTLAADLIVTGKTVIIDHGHNVFSSYSHLNTMTVKKGDKISKGEKVGEIGSTGFSTGPHLHWTIKVANVYVNPKYFIK